MDNELTKLSNELKAELVVPLQKRWGVDALGKVTIPANSWQSWCLTDKADDYIRYSAYATAILCFIGLHWYALTWVLLAAPLALYIQAVKRQYIGLTLHHMAEINYRHKIYHFYNKKYNLPEHKLSMATLLQKGVKLDDITNAYNRKYSDLHLKRRDEKILFESALSRLRQNKPTAIHQAHTKLLEARKELEDAGIDSY